MNLIDDFDKRKGTLVDKFAELAEDPSDDDEDEISNLTLSEEANK
jgi:hypothetical protein